MRREAPHTPPGQENLFPQVPNARAKGRAAGMPAKHDDAPRRVPLSALFGSRRQRTTGLNLRIRNQACSLATIPAASD